MGQFSCLFDVFDLGLGEVFGFEGEADEEEVAGNADDHSREKGVGGVDEAAEYGYEAGLQAEVDHVACQE